mgnify:CR=1 FL=1|tara:strand:+ start:94 stop:393 length:300 start_codon:yes stop_codon:yes gene_type:complete
MSDEIRKLLEDAAATPENETLKTDVLLNKTFTILDCRAVEGKFGTTWVGTLDVQGQTVEAWLNGAVVGRQLESIKDQLPVTVTLTRNEEKFGNPFELTL